MWVTLQIILFRIRSHVSRMKGGGRGEVDNKINQSNILMYNIGLNLSRDEISHPGQKSRDSGTNKYEMEPE